MKTLIWFLFNIVWWATFFSLTGCAGFTAKEKENIAFWEKFPRMTPHEYCTEVLFETNGPRWQKRFGSLDECKAWVPGAQARWVAEQERVGEEAVRKNRRERAFYSTMNSGFTQIGSAPAVYGGQSSARPQNCVTEEIPYSVTHEMRTICR